MKDAAPNRRELRDAAHALTEFAILSLGPEYLRWEKAINLGLAEFVWNTGGTASLADWGPDADPGLVELHDCLARARRTKWPDAPYHVVRLDVRRSGDDALFTFELTWDMGRTMHRCEMAWDPRGTSSPSLN